MENELQQLKQELLKEPILHHFNLERETRIYTDASEDWLGWIVTQITEDKKEVPVKYNSKTLNKSQKRYSTIDKELLAIYLAYKDTYYLTNGTTPLTICTDHLNLSLYMGSTIPLTKRAARLVDFILFNNIVIRHIPGKQNQMVDALSRLTSE